jgi:putative sigma-54 modulation protein
MNLNIIGSHLEITPAIRNHITSKLEKITKHFESITDINVIASADKLRHKVEITLHLPGKDLHTESEADDLYAAIDLMIDKLHMLLQKEKETRVDRRVRAEKQI